MMKKKMNALRTFLLKVSYAIFVDSQSQTSIIKLIKCFFNLLFVTNILKKPKLYSNLSENIKLIQFGFVTLKVLTNILQKYKRLICYYRMP